jgi:ketosteroid isomerase-like protein
MPEQSNVELIRAGYEAFTKGDIQGVFAVLADDIRWHIPGRNPTAGDYSGHDEVMQFFGKLVQLTGGTFQLELHDVVGNDDHVVALTDARGERNGRSLENGHAAHVWHVRDGKAVEFWGLVEDPYGNDEFWS